MEYTLSCLHMLIQSYPINIYNCDIKQHIRILECAYNTSSEITYSICPTFSDDWVKLKVHFVQLFNNVRRTLHAEVDTKTFQENVVKMFPDTLRLKFEQLFTGLSVAAILDRLLSLRLISTMNHHILEECLVDNIDSKHLNTEMKTYQERLVNEIWQKSLADFARGIETTVIKPISSKEMERSQQSCGLVLVKVTFIFEEKNDGLDAMYVKDRTDMIRQELKLNRHIFLLSNVYLTENSISIVYNVPREVAVSIAKDQTSISIKEWCERNQLLIRQVSVNLCT